MLLTAWTTSVFELCSKHDLKTRNSIKTHPAADRFIYFLAVQNRCRIVFETRLIWKVMKTFCGNFNCNEILLWFMSGAVDVTDWFRMETFQHETCSISNEAKGLSSADLWFMSMLLAFYCDVEVKNYSTEFHWKVPLRSRAFYWRFIMIAILLVARKLKHNVFCEILCRYFQ